jgi:hypothetical protein
MGVNLKQLADGSMGLEGYNADSGAFIIVTGEYTASSVDKTVAIMPRRMIVQGIVGRVTVAGTDASAVTAVVRKVSSGTAIASGTALHSGSFNLKGTADTNQTLTLSTTASDLIVEAGQAIAIDFTGTLTSATGIIAVFLTPA